MHCFTKAVSSLLSGLRFSVVGGLGVSVGFSVCILRSPIQTPLLSHAKM